MDIELTRDQCSDAASIQRVIDGLRNSGGTVQLPELDLELDRGIELYSGVHLKGRGSATVLRKGPSTVYPLTGYHNYGMKDVPLTSVAGLTPGMTVSILDDKRGGFYSTFTRVTWVENGWVGVERGVDSDYGPDWNPRLVTAYPLIFGHEIENAGVHDLVLDGNLGNNPETMNGCRGGAVYFAKCNSIEVSGVIESNYNGEGLSFQMCANMRILECEFSNNTGNGLHPGAGSTGALFKRCSASGNRKNGFYFCVRANHITVGDCTFERNTISGINIGTRDCHNLIEGCDIKDNDGPGILFRQSPASTEAHSSRVEGCRLSGNAARSGAGHIEIAADVHDVIIVHTEISGGSKPGVFVADGAYSVYEAENEFAGIERAGEGFTEKRPDVSCGYEAFEPGHTRHLTG